MTLSSDAIFQKIQDGVKENLEKAKSVKGVFLYKITKNGQVAKEWSKLSDRGQLKSFLTLSFPALDLRNGSVYEGPAKGIKVDTTLTVSDDDMVDIALGKLNPQQAFMKGKLKITGNIMLSQKLAPLLKTEAKL